MNEYDRLHRQAQRYKELYPKGTRILDFGESGYIPLDEDTEPNFLGETMTVSEFAEEEAQDEAMQMGGM